MSTDPRKERKHELSEVERCRLLTILVKLYHSELRSGDSRVPIEELCDQCLSTDDVKRVIALKWVSYEEHGRGILFLNDCSRSLLLNALNAISPLTKGKSAKRPHWNRAARELRLDGRLLKYFPKTAPNQEAVLLRFESLGWPERIDDPLPPSPEIVPATRLRDTIKQLNRTLDIPAIQFRADGTGTGVTWVNAS